MPKERNYNPVQAQRKADKAKAIKKGKATVAASRNERLAKTNPDRIRKQIDDLKAITEGGGKLTRHEEQVLEGLEKELKAVIKAREALGDRAPTFGRGPSQQHDNDRQGGTGRKRRHDDEDDNSSGDSDVPEDVRRIPMPRDTPPPIPKRVLDEWYAKRRARRNANTNANTLPLGQGRGGRRRHGDDMGGPSETLEKGTAPKANAAAAPQKPIEVKTVYEAKPVLRDLQKEAVTAFMPTVVRRKLDKSRGMGGLVEPEEADRLEREGYLKSSVAAGAASGAVSHHHDKANDSDSDGDDNDNDNDNKNNATGNDWRSKRDSGTRVLSHSPQVPAGVLPGSRRVTIEEVDDADEG
ncbi:tetracycline transporter [Niveomyces insectorum RCEF 264]|uniref:Tetracycline transporter n=1 Tax=Niveomyces insectorum RCEF 264 TaxID=1081102 RepID=A0A167VCX2_9HYPO|nr:tetracycline transporter [Niveomyces insectorum RCEF 264]